MIINCQFIGLTQVHWPSKQIVTKNATSIGHFHFKNTSRIENDFNNSNQNFHNIFEMCIGQKTSLKFMDSRGEDLMRPKDQN